MQIQPYSDGFDLILDGRLVLRHRHVAPCLFVGRGEARMDMYRGNFDIEDYVVERTPLASADVTNVGDGYRIAFSAAPGQAPRLTLTVSGDAESGIVHFLAHDPSVNRIWLRVTAETR